MSKHTKGPWAPRSSRQGLFVRSGRAVIAKIDQSGSKDAFSNALLIAASPEMLEAMIQFDHWLKNFLGKDTYEEISCQAMRDFQAAILKARGEK